jgi:urease accessory protein
MTIPMNNRYLLLQINDAAFPIGAYAHSFGLETYVQVGAVHDAPSARDYLEQMLQNVFLYGDLLLARLAWQAARAACATCAAKTAGIAGQAVPETRSLNNAIVTSCDTVAITTVDAVTATDVAADVSQNSTSFTLEELATLESLEELACASRTPLELREASVKLGSRFAKTTAGFSQDLSPSAQHSYAIAYGEFCALHDIDLQEALSAFIFAQTSAQITTCVKLIPLSQTAGQILLAGFYPLFDQLLASVLALTADDLFRSTPGYDIRAMQHEQLYSRLYMS